MKAVLISIQPKWVEKIANDKKTIEVRKTRPKLETPFKCYIYMTQGDFKDLWIYSELIYKNRSKVIGEFVCDRITQYNCDRDYQEYFVSGYVGAYMPTREMCLTQQDLFEYGKGKPLYGWHISKLVIYDKPKGLCEFKKPTMPTGLKWENNSITRPPMSWCYVEKGE